MKSNSVEVLTKRCRLNYVRLAEMESYMDSKPYYSVVLMVPKSDTEGLKVINDAIVKAIDQTDLKINKNSKKFWNPFIDGLDKDDDRFHDYFYIKCKSQFEVPIVGRDNKIMKKDDPRIYSGCWGRAHITLKVYNKGGEGVSCYLNSLQILEDGDILESSRNFNPEEAFPTIPDEYKNLL
jgi:hypothetical protein